VKGVGFAAVSAVVLGLAVTVPAWAADTGREWAAEVALTVAAPYPPNHLQWSGHVDLSVRLSVPPGVEGDDETRPGWLVFHGRHVRERFEGCGLRRETLTLDYEGPFRTGGVTEHYVDEETKWLRFLALDQPDTQGGVVEAFGDTWLAENRTSGEACGESWPSAGYRFGPPFGFSAADLDWQTWSNEDSDGVPRVRYNRRLKPKEVSATWAEPWVLGTTIPPVTAQVTARFTRVSGNLGSLVPRLGASVVAEVLRGVVRVRRPGARRFEELVAEGTVPVRSLVDTRAGTVRLTSARDSTGKTQSGEFSGGVFQVLQSRRKGADGLTELRLKGSGFRRCRSGSGPAARAAGSANRGCRAGRSVVCAPKRRAASEHAAAIPPPPCAAPCGSPPTAATARSPRSRAARSPCATCVAERPLSFGQARATWPARARKRGRTSGTACPPRRTAARPAARHKLRSPKALLRYRVRGRLG
jgi:hypothetical protein